MPIQTEFADVFRALDPEKLKIVNNMAVPNEVYQEVLDFFLERGYLNYLPQRECFSDHVNQGLQIRHPVGWLHMLRLPVHPSDMEGYDLFSRWQSTLATLHAWGHRVIFVMQRIHGETQIYLGAASLTQGITVEMALEQFHEAATSNMPGIDLRPLNQQERIDMVESLAKRTCIGTVTGIPSLRKNTKFGLLQTLDQLAFGVRDTQGRECDFSLMVIADPVDDITISKTISNLRRLSSQIHLDVQRSVTVGEGLTESKTSSLGIGSMLAAVGRIMPLASVGAIVGGLGAMMTKTHVKGASSNQNVSTQYLDKFAQYAEQVVEQHCVRLNRGRNLGFWNTGVYVLGQSSNDIHTVMGMLRAVYSGDESFIEPIRVNLLSVNAGALDIVRRGDLLPLEMPQNFPEARVPHAPEPETMGDNEPWNILGEIYQYVSTPLNTEELSIATSLPRRDVPGLRFIKTAVRFASNAALAVGDVIHLGSIMDAGIQQSTSYTIDMNALVRHALVTGSTGSGKTTTCKNIINEVLAKDVPVLIIEPAKDEYVRWALEYNHRLDDDQSLTEAQRAQRRFDIYMPGMEMMDGVRLKRLKLNPFQPAAIEDAPIDMMTRVEQITALINASLPVADVLPVLIDETLFTYAMKSLGTEASKNEQAQRDEYPRLDGVMATARQVLAARGYDKRVQDDIGAALQTRFSYLTRGKRGDILNVNRSTDAQQLFGHPTVINVSRLASAKDKALIMSILLLSLYEFRISAYTYDESYRVKMQQNKLSHLTVIEEAHNLLMKPVMDTSGAGNPQQVVADLFTNILSEIRSYGQGMMIVDQVPTRLIADAIKNTNYKIVHRLVAPDDCSVMAAGLALRPDQVSTIAALSIGDAIVCGDMDDAAAWVHLNKPAQKQARR